MSAFGYRHRYKTCKQCGIGRTLSGIDGLFSGRSTGPEVGESLACINFQKVDRMKLYELLERKLEGIVKLSSAISAMEMSVSE